MSQRPPTLFKTANEFGDRLPAKLRSPVATRQIARLATKSTTATSRSRLCACAVSLPGCCLTSGRERVTRTDFAEEHEPRTEQNRTGEGAELVHDELHHRKHFQYGDALCPSRRHGSGRGQRRPWPKRNAAGRYTPLNTSALSTTVCEHFNEVLS